MIVSNQRLENNIERRHYFKVNYKGLKVPYIFNFISSGFSKFYKNQGTDE